jgi:hypothetical protein
MDKLIQHCKQYFPNLEIKFKNESNLMKLLGEILFFNKSFMTKYTTTLGNVIYFPNREYVNKQEIMSKTILLHELVHMHDSKKLSRFLFSLLYLFPQILLPLTCLLFLASWKIALPLLIISLLPLPAYFRMNFEKRGYLTSLYVINTLCVRKGIEAPLEDQKDIFLKEFYGPSYYYMWTFHSIEEDFDEAIDKIIANQHPFEDEVFVMIDDLLKSA